MVLTALIITLAVVVAIGIAFAFSQHRKNKKLEVLIGEINNSIITYLLNPNNGRLAIIENAMDTLRLLKIDFDLTFEESETLENLRKEEAIEPILLDPECEVKPAIEAKPEVKPAEVKVGFERIIPDESVAVVEAAEEAEKKRQEKIEQILIKKRDLLVKIDDLKVERDKVLAEKSELVKKTGNALYAAVDNREAIKVRETAFEANCKAIQDHEKSENQFETQLANLQAELNELVKSIPTK